MAKLLTAEQLAALVALARQHADATVNGPWTADGACTAPAAPSMFPEGQPAYRVALAVCDGCAVVGQCLAAGLHEQYGVWGATTPTQRRQVRKALRDAGEPVALFVRRPIPHGTPAGYQRCRAAQGVACDPCREAHRTAAAARRDARRQRVA